MTKRFGTGIGETICLTCRQKVSLKDAWFMDHEANCIYRTDGRKITDEKNIGQEIPDNAETKLLHIKWRNGFPCELEVEHRWDRGKKKKTSRAAQRLCPHCLQPGQVRPDGVRTPLLPYAGEYPSFYGFLLSPPETGKSSFLSAIQQVTAQNKMGDILGTPLRLTRVEADRQKRHSPTPLGSHLIRDFAVRDAGNNIKAVLYLIDTAGETVLEQTQDAQQRMQQKTLELIRQYADFVLCFFDPRSIRDSDDLAGILENHSKPSGGSPYEILSKLDHRILPVLNILTCADELKAAAEEHSGIRCRDSNVPMLLPKSELLKEAHTAEELRRHMVMAWDFMRENCPSFAECYGQACFVVSNGKVNGENIDYAKAENVHLPLSYLLSELGLSSVRKER